MPKTCSEYGQSQNVQDGYFTVDPLQKPGWSSKLKVKCNFAQGKGA